MRAQSAVRLPDGRIAVFHWGDGDGDCIAVYTPVTDRWEVPTVTDLDQLDGCGFESTSGLAPHLHGRLYGLGRVVDPTVDPWTVAHTPWRGEWTMPSSIGTTTDGRLYGPDNLAPGVQLYEFDVTTGTLALASEYRVGPLDDVVAGVAPRLYMGTNDYDTGTSPLVSYDPVTGEWRAEGAAPFRADWESAAHGPDGWIYAPESSNRLWARHPRTGEWVQVQLPADLRDRWEPAFVDGGDGRLYAMDAHQPYVFVPDEVREVAVP